MAASCPGRLPRGRSRTPGSAPRGVPIAQGMATGLIGSRTRPCIEVYREPLPRSQTLTISPGALYIDLGSVLATTLRACPILSARPVQAMQISAERSPCPLRFSSHSLNGFEQLLQLALLVLMPPPSLAPPGSHIVHVARPPVRLHIWSTRPPAWADHALVDAVLL